MTKPRETRKASEDREQRTAPEDEIVRAEARRSGGGGATFNIGSQKAATIQNVGGDMVVEGNLISAGTLVVELRGELSQLVTEVGRLELPADERQAVEEELAGAEAAAAAEAPDAGGIAGRLEKATAVLHDAGALVGGGAAVAQSLQRLGELLGPAGRTLLALLSAL